jgi:hypothetical protein
LFVFVTLEMPRFVAMPFGFSTVLDAGNGSMCGGNMLPE